MIIFHLNIKSDRFFRARLILCKGILDTPVLLCSGMPESLYFKHFSTFHYVFFVIKTTVSTWHEEMILLAHTSYLFAQSRIGTYPPFWALGRSPMQEHIDKLEFVI